VTDEVMVVRRRSHMDDTLRRPFAGLWIQTG